MQALQAHPNASSDMMPLHRISKITRGSWRHQLVAEGSHDTRYAKTSKRSGGAARSLMRTSHPNGVAMATFLAQVTQVSSVSQRASKVSSATRRLVSLASRISFTAWNCIIIGG